MDKYLHTASILFWSPYYSESSSVVEVSEAEVAAAAEVLLGYLELHTVTIYWTNIAGIGNVNHQR